MQCPTSRCTRCCHLNGANGGESDCDYCRKADSVILLCTSAYFGRDCNEQPLKDRIQDPWYPINPYTLEPSSVPDRSQQLREIDLSRIFINGRVIKATVIIAIGDEPDIDWLENINFPANPVVKECFVASSIDNICRRRFGETPPEVIGKIPYKEPGPSCKPGPWLIWGYFPNWGAYYWDCLAVSHPAWCQKYLSEIHSEISQRQDFLLTTVHSKIEQKFRVQKYPEPEEDAEQDLLYLAHILPAPIAEPEPENPADWGEVVYNIPNEGGWGVPDGRRTGTGW